MNKPREHFSLALRAQRIIDYERKKQMTPQDSLEELRLSKIERDQRVIDYANFAFRLSKEIGISTSDVELPKYTYVKKHLLRQVEMRAEQRALDREEEKRQSQEASVFCRKKIIEY